MNGKLNKYLGLPWIIVALFFLFEPCVLIFDVFPDFLGYFIIYLALTNLADLNDHIESSKKWFKYAILIGLARYLSLVFVAFVSAGNPSESTMWRTLMVFLVSTADAVVAALAFRSLFDGLSYLGTFNGGRAVNEYRKNPRRADRAEAAGKPYKAKLHSQNASVRGAALCTFFVIAKNLACMLPEFTSLITDQEYTYAPLLRALAIVIAAFVGVIWLVSMIRYFASVLRDKQFIQNLRDKYNEEVSTRSELFLCRRICFIFLFALVGFVLTPEIYSDHYSVLPDAIACIPMIVFSILMMKQSKKAPLLTVSAGLSLVASVVYWAFTTYYYDHHTPMSYLRNPEAEAPFLRMYYSSIVSSIFFAITCGICMLLIYDLIKKHTGKVGDSRAASVYNAMLHKKYGKLLIGGFILSVISAASTAFYVYTRPIVNPSSPWYLTGSVVIIFAIDLIFAVYMVVLINSITSDIKTKYSYF